jgi:spore germination protein
MGKVKDKQLTLNQFKLLLVGFALGPELLRLPNILADTAKQDAWIAAIIGLLYPIFIVLVCSFIINKHPQDTILDISRAYFGKIIGNTLNFIFLLQFAIYSATTVTEINRVLRIYIVSFLTPFRISLVVIVIAAYISTRGLKVLGKTNEFITYFLLISIVTSVSAISLPNIKNIMPIFDVGISNILKSATKTVYFYKGFEAIILFHPYVENIKKVKNAGLGAVAISGVVWAWIVFITIFFLGVDILPKANWSFIFIFENLNFPLINNFRYIIMFGLTLVGFRVVANYLYAASFALNDLTGIDIKKICIFISIFAFIVSVGLAQRTQRTYIKEDISMVFACFNIAFISLIAIRVLVRKNKGYDAE